MSFESRRQGLLPPAAAPRVVNSAPAALVVLALLAAAFGCGKEGPPVPPFRAVPAPSRDLAVRQRGPRAILSFTYPQTTPAGKALNGVSAVEVWETQRPLPTASAQAPEPLDPRQFASLAKQRLKLNAKEVSAATVGNRIEIELDLPQPIPSPPAAHFYAVKTFGMKGDASEHSNQGILVAKAPPLPPEDVTVTPRADGILVEWVPAPQPPEPPAPAPAPAPPAPTGAKPGATGKTTAAAATTATPARGTTTAPAPGTAATPARGTTTTPAPGMAATPAAPGTTAAPAPAATGAAPAAAPAAAAAAPAAPAPLPPGAGGFNVYRRGAQQRTSYQPLHVARPGERSYLDTSASFGQSYIYTVTTLDRRDPQVESAVRTEREIKYVDRFPPPVPSDLVAIADATRVRLVWKPSEAADLAGYIVYRQGPAGGDFVRLNEKPVTSPGYVDSSAAAGQSYTYRVTAIDQSGNESAPGPVARVSTPR